MLRTPHPVFELSDGSHIRVSEFGWTILDGDGRATPSAVIDEAWDITLGWVRLTDA